MPDTSPSDLLTCPFIEVRTRRDFVTIKELRQERPFIAVSTPGAGNALGIPWWLAVVGDRASRTILDCGASLACANQALANDIGWAICHGYNGAEKRILDRLPEYHILRTGSSPFSVHLQKIISSLQGKDAPVPNSRNLSK